MNYSTPLFYLNADNLVIFDAGVDNLQQLIDGIKLSQDWAVLNANQDGIEQITRILANYYSEIQMLRHSMVRILLFSKTVSPLRS